MARLRGNRWQADVLVDNVRVRRSFASQKEAEAFERQLIEAKPTVKQCFTAGLSYYWKGKPNERNTYRITWELIEFFGPETEPITITTSAIRGFVQHLRESKNNADATINRKLAALSKLLNYCLDEEVIKVLPKIESFTEPKGRLRFITEEEEKDIFKHLLPEHRALATFLLYTGCRVGEALGLQWRDVGKTWVTFWETKNGDSRTLPLTPEAFEALEYMRGHERPWVIDYEAIRYDFKRAVQHAGLTEVTLHTLRHTCASRMAQRGVDIRRVKDWMGHRNITTTMRYAHLAPGDLMQAALALSGRSNNGSVTGLAQLDTTVPTVPNGARHKRTYPPEISDGGMSRAAKGADCKSAGLAFVGSSPTSPTNLLPGQSPGITAPT